MKRILELDEMLAIVDAEWPSAYDPHEFDNLEPFDELQAYRESQKTANFELDWHDYSSDIFPGNWKSRSYPERFEKSWKGYDIWLELTDDQWRVSFQCIPMGIRKSSSKLFEKLYTAMFVSYVGVQRSRFESNPDVRSELDQWFKHKKKAFTN